MLNDNNIHLNSRQVSNLDFPSDMQDSYTILVGVVCFGVRTTYTFSTQTGFKFSSDLRQASNLVLINLKPV